MSEIVQLFKLEIPNMDVYYTPFTLCGSCYVTEYRLFKFKLDDQYVWGLYSNPNNSFFSSIYDYFVDKNTYIKDSIVFVNIHECVYFLKKENYPDILLNKVNHYIKSCVNLDHLV